MSDKSKRWQNGAAKREHFFLSELLKLTNNTKNLDAVSSQVQNRLQQLEEVHNKYDLTPYMASVVGVVFGLGLAILFLSENAKDLGFYLVFLAIFHMWEFTYVVLFHPENLTSDSFMLNHSPEFLIAMGVAFVEYVIEFWLFPGMKGSWLVIVPAVLVVAGGQAIRTLAMFTAGRSFNHIIQESKADDHVLVTTGIYGYLRHPSYFGWFWWAIGMATLLGNPISIVLFAYAAWRFFADRIPYEEQTLIRHFGKVYETYRSKVKTGIPMIP